MRVSKKYINIIIIVMTVITMIINVAAAAPAVGELQKIRSSQHPDKVRIVFDLSVIPSYSVNYFPDLSYIQIDMPNTVNKGALSKLLFNDSHVSAVRIVEIEPRMQRVYIELKATAVYNVFSLAKPSRLVIDIGRQFEQKVKTEISPGIMHTYWLRGQEGGPVTANILEVDLSKGYSIKPLLSNSAVQGLETLSAMAEKAKAIAAVNGSYFATNGQILGLMKLDSDIISVPAVARSAVGIMPDGGVFFDQVEYKGTVVLPGNKEITISGVNSDRGNDKLVVYTGFFGGTTQTNRFGIEYTIENNKVIAVNNGDSLIPPGAVVISAHGEAAQRLEGLKVGDKVEIKQTLGSEWDKTRHAIGAGPTLVRDGNVFLTTKVEEFGSDVAGGRAPRTAIGLTQDKRLLLVTVDGRQVHSTGLTLLELALFMQELGAVDSINLDGGGSTEMVIYDKVINKPSDGKERRMGNGLAIIAPQLAN